MKRREFLIHGLGLASSATGLASASAAAQSKESPAQGHRTLDLELFDAGRRRPVPTRLYLPLQAHPGKPVPLVVFSHGLGGSRMGYRYLASHWADAGMASLHPQHVGSDHEVWRGNPLELLQRLQSAARETEALARVLDLRFALDRILNSDHSGWIDASKIAVAGHSYGANTAMLSAGAKVDTGSALMNELQDSRIKAAILISAPPLVGQGPAAKVLGAVSVPTLHITSLEDTINIPGYRSTVQDRIAIFEAMARSSRTLAVYNTGGHSIFTDRTTRSGPETSARIKGATQALCTIFLRQTLGVGPQMSSMPVPVLQAPLDSGQQALPETPSAPQNLQQWRERHEGLLERFVSV